VPPPPSISSRHPPHRPKESLHHILNVPGRSVRIPSVPFRDRSVSGCATMTISGDSICGGPCGSAGAE
jgi:hypothetical protein